MLHKCGCECEVAADGAEAIQKATEGHFDVIFMDLLMPQYDGFEVCCIFNVFAFLSSICRL